MSRLLPSKADNFGFISRGPWCGLAQVFSHKLDKEVKIQYSDMAGWDPDSDTLFLPGLPSTGVKKELLPHLRSKIMHESAGERGITTWNPKKPEYLQYPGLRSLVNCVNDVRIDTVVMSDHLGYSIDRKKDLEWMYEFMVNEYKDHEPCIGSVASLLKPIGCRIVTREEVLQDLPQYANAFSRIWEWLIPGLGMGNDIETLRDKSFQPKAEAIAKTMFDKLKQDIPQSPSDDGNPMGGQGQGGEEGESVEMEGESQSGKPQKDGGAQGDTEDSGNGEGEGGEEGEDEAEDGEDEGEAENASESGENGEDGPEDGQGSSDGSEGDSGDSEGQSEAGPSTDSESSGDAPSNGAGGPLGDGEEFDEWKLLTAELQSGLNEPGVSHYDRMPALSPGQIFRVVDDTQRVLRRKRDQNV